MHRSWNYIHDYIGAAVSWDEASPIAPLTKGELRRNENMRKHGIAGWTVKCPVSASGQHKWGQHNVDGVRKCLNCGNKQCRDADGVFYHA